MIYSINSPVARTHLLAYPPQFSRVCSMLSQLQTKNDTATVQYMYNTSNTTICYIIINCVILSHHLPSMRSVRIPPFQTTTHTTTNAELLRNRWRAQFIYLLTKLYPRLTTNVNPFVGIFGLGKNTERQSENTEHQLLLIIITLQEHVLL